MGQSRKTGQITQRSAKSWQIRVFIGLNEKGKRKYKNKTVKGKKKDAQKVLNSMLRDADLGLLGNAQKQTLNEYLDFWLDNIAKPRSAYRTYNDYKDLMRLYIRKTIGSMKLANLKVVHIQKVYADMEKRGLSPRRIRYTHTVLSSSLKKAVELDILPRNVAKFVQLPKQIRKEMDVLSQDEVSVFFETLENERFETLFRFAIATGMRIQEYFSIKWKDIDFDRQTATVQRAIVWHRKGGGWHFKQPKTSKSRRNISLPSEIIQNLKTHRKKQLEARLKLGAAWNDFDLVFPSEIGTPLNPPNVTRHFKRVLKTAGIRTSIRLNDLRHTTATLLLQESVHPKVVQERLGHSTTTLTMDVYSHVLPTMQKDATEKLEQLIFKNNN